MKVGVGKLRRADIRTIRGRAGAFEMRLSTFCVSAAQEEVAGEKENIAVTYPRQCSTEHNSAEIVRR